MSKKNKKQEEQAVAVVVEETAAVETEVQAAEPAATEEPAAEIVAQAAPEAAAKEVVDEEVAKLAEQAKAAVAAKRGRTRELDQYGIAVGTLCSKGMELIATGKYTMKQVEAELGDVWYSSIRIARNNGWTVTKLADGTYSVSKS